MVGEGRRFKFRKFYFSLLNPHTPVLNFVSVPLIVNATVIWPIEV